MDESQNQINIVDRCAIIKRLPIFSAFNDTQLAELQTLFTENFYQPGSVIVAEGQLIDSIHILTSGAAEVTQAAKKKIPIAKLTSGDTIGLNEYEFYSATGKRSATVTALQTVSTLAITVADLSEFFKLNNLETNLSKTATQILMMSLIKQSLPFAKISAERLQWLAKRIEVVAYKKGEIIFHQGEVGDKCYLIQKGEVEIFSVINEQERQLAILSPPTLFGEATLITGSPRNATARVFSDCHLLVLQHAHLTELIESEKNVASMFMTLMVDRSQPGRNPMVTLHQRKSADGQDITILKNPMNGNYFKLSSEGAFIWELMDGSHTLQEITLELADKLDIFAPEVVAGIVSKLSKAGFIINLDLNDAPYSNNPTWMKGYTTIKKYLQLRFVLEKADPWLTSTYDRYIKYFLTPVGKLLNSMIALIGLILFIFSTHSVLTYFNLHKTSLLLLIILIPFSLIKVLFHELGHAYAVKAFGREVHYLGVGWNWFSPIAFTDTSDMWLSARKPRMWVNVAGIYVDLIIAGMTGILIYLVPNPIVKSMLWLFALYTYLGAFRMLSPLQEMDGYYILMDWLEKSRLRQASLIWLVKKLPSCVKKPELFKLYKPEIFFWLACIGYLILVCVITLTVMTFILSVLGIHSNPYLSLSIPFIVLIASTLKIAAEIRAKAE